MHLFFYCFHPLEGDTDTNTKAVEVVHLVGQHRTVVRCIAIIEGKVKTKTVIRIWEDAYTDLRREEESPSLFILLDDVLVG